MEEAVTPRDRGALLESWALEEGFDLAGACALGPLDAHQAYEPWVSRGDAAEMDYMTRRVEERKDPRRLVPGARSALCVGWKYWPVEGESISGDLWSGVARYARGRDYHDVMTKRLRRLNERIEAGFPGSRGRWYVDTGPILERELAARAGIGAVGKNTLLLSADAGSWFLLGEILLTLDLAAGHEVSDLCGRCTACLDACPTGALPEPYRLDSRRCISYWTIEHRGAVPMERRPEMGQWVFGCDVCQEVCPINTEAVANKAASSVHLKLPETRRELNLIDLLRMDRETYVEAFRRSPMKRAKLPGLKRNAAIAMGNLGDAKYLDALVEVLLAPDEDGVARSHAAWAVGQIGGEAARQALQRAAATVADVSVSTEIDSALEALDGPRVRG